MMIIIADDLTGANDSGVQLSKQGLKTLVYIDPLNWQDDSQSNNLFKGDVLVIDTETRELSGEEAAEASRKITAKLRLDQQKNATFYKKIDSTLRGNIGKELEVLMDFLDKDLCILAPSFPGNNRLTVGGYLLVNNEPLGLSQYYQGGLDPWQGSYIPDYIQQQTDLPVGLVELKDVMQGEKVIFKQIEALQKKGKKIIVFDAALDSQLRDIVNSSKRLNSSILYCGSAGLANHFSSLNSSKREDDYLISSDKKPILMVVGTRNKVMEEQIKYLSRNLLVSYLKIDLLDIFGDKKGSLKSYTSKALAALEGEKHLIIHPDPDFNQQEAADEILQAREISFRGLETKIRDFLAELTANILAEAEIRDLFVTGGDTAIGICNKLGIKSLLIREEILPGIPLSSPENSKYQRLRLVTKAGGFGGEETLYKIVSKLSTNREVKV
ncbi:hypothetical protein GM661_18450 [Iocasia frigidifontis]|uniref:Four-carbon acid sugar kinase family protein n=1 Tax=Iocasia fonsfrigidae TaxID=2682810 RepID=A0A8A7KP15_9FIRM|nr:four-carbon acid sugar kinase family protein [Iocasia fonsfrigidae]QTL99794.1 hypothetical protein GM661_18450 [Iocasia fonsfrigidae]